MVREYGPKKPDEMDYLLHNFENGKGRLWKPLSEANWREELNEIPLFMDHAPSEAEIEKNSTLQAIQSLVYDGTPEEIALNFKEQGNEIVRDKQVALYREARSYYSRALEQNCSDQNLNISCLINRAFINLELKNYGRVVADCREALGMETDNKGLHVKAIYRLSLACVELKKYEIAMKCISEGLSMDPKNDSLRALNTRVLKQLANTERAEQMRLERLNRLKQDKIKFCDLLTARGVKFMPSSDLTLRDLIVDGQLPEEVEYPENILQVPEEYRQHRISTSQADDDDSVNYPVIVAYPLLDTFDFVVEWNETVKFRDQLTEMLSDRDDDQMMFEDYRDIGKLSVYVPGFDGSLVRVRMLSTLADAVKISPMPRDLIFKCFILPTATASTPEAKNWTSSDLR